jgi:hypothetical protein
MLVDLATLSQETQDHLPLSVRLQKIVEVFDLPLNLQYIILNNKLVPVKTGLYRPINIIDADFQISPYNDFNIDTSKRSAIIKYIKNYLLTPKGTYPFDPEFGNSLKRHLQTRDTTIRETLLTAEMKRIVSTIQDSFNINIKILGSQLIPVNVLDKIEYQINIKFSIEDTVVNFGVG